MIEWELRELFCDIGRRVWQKGFVAANDGNFSARIDEKRILVTPTMVSKGFMKPEDLVVLDIEGKQLEGFRKPTSEIKLHLEILKNRNDVNAIVHTHPPYATAFAVVQEPIPKCILPEVEISLGEIPIIKYETPGSQEIVEAVKPFLNDFNLFLLANHGAIAMGLDLMDAYYKIETIDQYCRILLYAYQIGDPKKIDQRKIQELFKIKEKLGISDRRIQKGIGVSCEFPAPAPGSSSNVESHFISGINHIEKSAKESIAPSGLESEIDINYLTEIVIKVLREKGITS